MDTAKLHTLCERIGMPLTASELGSIRPAIDKIVLDRTTGEARINLDEAIFRANKGPYSSPAGTNYTIGGSVAPGFEPVREGFEQNFRDGLERDAQLCIYWQGKIVVDLYGSSTDCGWDGLPYSKLPVRYDGDTLQTVFSSTKCAAATVFAIAVDRGLLKYSDPVCKHWPEFAANGKEHLTIADILRHDAGLQSFAQPITRADLDDQKNPNGTLSRVIAATAPWTWAGGPDRGKTPRIYHGSSRGLVLNQILVRVDPLQRTVGEWMMQEIAVPLGLDFYCGPGGANGAQAAGSGSTTQVVDWAAKPSASMQPPPLAFVFVNDSLPKLIQSSFPEKYPADPGTQALAEYTSSDVFQYNPARDAQDRHVPSPQGDMKQMDSPSGNGFANARGMAKMMAMLSMGGEIDGVRLLSREGVEDAIQHPVRNTARNHEAALNRMLPTVSVCAAASRGTGST